MMKKIIIMLVLFIIITNQTIVHASTIEDESKQDTKEVEQLYDYMTNMKTKYELLKDLNITDYIKDFMKTGDGKFSFQKLSKALISYFFSELIASFKLMIMLLIICVICALLTNLQRAFSNESLSNIAYFACYSLIIIIVAKSFYIGVNEVKDATNNLTDFMVALMPVLLSLLAAGGGIAQSTLMDPIIIFAINVAARIFMDLLLPLILISFVLHFVNNISEEYKVDRLAKLLSQIVLWIQGLVMTIFIAIVTIRGINAKAIDEVTAKTAKFAVDNFVPIVGKALSDAISTVVGYSVVLKNAISSIGLIILVAIVVFPIIKILALALIHKLTAALVQPISDKRIVNCINAAGDTLILLMSCLISISVMFFIMIAIIASSGNVV
ncbi:stage III sporulation protein AE [Clostridium sp.]|uniref:stage III sporulation protein AE n=1 Tax=Clostridium sp. TaxID=1506 RepID=UPI00258F674A|nr:stage III sporulation protein AE [Clostridium sp.]MDF2503322.1 stage sporulation protein [Clostridium sp.]